MQWDETARISRDELQEGDLVFYNDLAHVGMYIGGGEIIHAPNSTSVVKIVDMDSAAPSTVTDARNAERSSGPCGTGVTPRRRRRRSRLLTLLLTRNAPTPPPGTDQ